MVIESTENQEVNDQFGEVHWLSLRAAAIDILRTPCPVVKARKTEVALRRWKEGDLPVTLGAEPDLVPDSPARPAIIGKGKAKGGSMKAMIHGVCHAESYAIDLMWDSVARFALGDGEGGAAPPEAFFDEWVQIACEEARHFSAWAEHLK
ncbi:unnamed protein product, partial [Polarella glacialis]